MERVIKESAFRRLMKREVLRLDPHSAIAIKRDVHEFEVNVDAETFAEAFRDVVTDPENMFGLIRVKRTAERMGRTFEVGERFQGCFSLDRAMDGAVQRSQSGGMVSLARQLWQLVPPSLIEWLEDQFLSNYAQIELIDFEPAPEDPYRMRYCYLEGTPIAGSSTFTVEPLGPDRCRVTQTFEFQEQNDVALTTFQRFGLKFHDQVVHQQIHQAASRAGANEVAGTIPTVYGELL